MKNQTKPNSTWSRSRRKSHRAAMRKRETWMPTMQAAHRERDSLALRARLHKAEKKPLPEKNPQPAENRKSKVAIVGSGGSLGRLPRLILGLFRKRAVTV